MSKKLKRLLRAAQVLDRLPLPGSSPAALREPTDLVTEFVKAWDHGDSDRIGELFVEDADFINVVGLWWTSRRSIVKAHRYGFERIFDKARITVEKVTERRLGEDVAVVIARWQISGQIDPDGEPVDPRRGIISATLLRLADGTWLGVTCHNTDIAAAADTNVSRGGKLTATSYLGGPTPEEVAASELVDE